MAYLPIPYAILPSIQQTHIIDDDDDDDDDDPATVHRSILSLAENKRYEWRNMFKGLVGAWCVGSSHGWLILLDKNGVPFLLNPSSATCINLPPLPQTFMRPVTQSYFAQFLRKSFIVKAVLMCPASPSNHILVIIYGCQCKIAYCKSAMWVELNNAKHSYCDIVFTNNYLYALAQDGSIEGWNLCQHIPRKVLFVRPTMEINYEEKEFSGDKYSKQLYLVIYGGGFLMVVRHIGNFVNEYGTVVEEGDTLSCEDSHPLLCPYRTKHFSVYKLDLGDKRWEKMRSLHDQVLFLGVNESISIPAETFSGCEANSIYFTDDRWDEMNLDYLYGGHDWGVFNLQDRCVKLLMPYASRIDPPPVWVVPARQFT